MAVTRNWLVLWQPLNGHGTVNEIKVIDAWQSTNGTQQDALTTMHRNMAGYMKDHGKGRVKLVETTGDNWNLIIA